MYAKIRGGKKDGEFMEISDSVQPGTVILLADTRLSGFPWPPPRPDDLAPRGEPYVLRFERDRDVFRTSGPLLSIEDPQGTAERAAFKAAFKAFREERPLIERHQSDLVTSEFTFYDRDTRRWTFDVTVTRLSRVLEHVGGG